MNLSHVALYILPGWGGSEETWQECLSVMRPVLYSVDVIELPCFGKNPCPDRVYTTDDYADVAYQALVRCIDTLPSHVTPVLLGHSFGGAVAARVVAKHPDIASRLILVAPAIVRPRYGVKRAIGKVLSTVGKICLFPVRSAALYPRMRNALYRLLRVHDYEQSSGIQRAIFLTVTRESSLQHCEHIHIPTDIVWGDKDQMTPIRELEKIIAVIPRAHVTVIAGGTHGLHHVPHRDRFLEALYERLSE